MIGPLPLIAPIVNPKKEKALLLVNDGAINSLLTTGLLMPVVQRSLVQRASGLVARDLNYRLFRARSGEGMPGHNGWDLAENGGHSRQGQVRSFDSSLDSTMVQYLQFVASQNIDYRVALGLRDGVEVEYNNDSLFEGESLWAAHPMALMGGPAMLSAVPLTAKAVVAAPEGSGGKEVAEDKAVFADQSDSRFKVFTEFDYGFYDQDNLTDLVRGFDSDTYAGTLGVEYRLLPWLQVGGAFSYLESDTELTANLGGIDLEGTVLSAYATAFWRRIYFDVLYSYGDFDNDINRNTLLGRRALGDTDSFSHNVSINVGQSYALGSQVVAGPYAGLDYATGGIGSYAERGGGSANLIYPEDNFESMVGRLGWQVTCRANSALGPLTLQGRAGWGHEFMPEADTVRAGLANSPFILVTGNSAHRVGGFAAERDSAHPGQDWLELGAGLRFDLNRDWNLQCDYEGQFGRNNASAHFASAKLEYEWGERFLSSFAESGCGEDSPVAAPTDGDASVSNEPPAVATAAAESDSGADADAAESGASDAPVGVGPKGIRGFLARLGAARSPMDSAAEEATPVGRVESASDTTARPVHVAEELPSPAPVEANAAEPEYYQSWDEVPGRSKKSATGVSATESAALDDGEKEAVSPSGVAR